MTIRSKLTVGPVGVAASATLAIGVVGVLPAQLALADPPPTPSATVVAGSLVIHGTPRADTITVGVGTDPSTFVVDFGGAAAPRSFDRASFGTIFVSLGQGDDRFSVNSQGQFSDHQLVVFGGDGNDVISGSAGNDILTGGRGNDTIRGNAGDDLILGGSGDDNVDGERGTDTELLGSGDDTALWLPGEGSDVINGGDGRDTLTFIGNGGNEKFALTAAGSHAVLTRDLGSITMDTDQVENLDLATLGGTDAVNVGDLTGTHLRTDNIDLSSAGAPDGQLDTVSVNGTDRPDHVSVATAGAAVQVDGLHTQTRITGNDTLDQLHVSTGGGDDSVAVSAAAAARLRVSVDLGADQS